MGKKTSTCNEKSRLIFLAYKKDMNAFINDGTESFRALIDSPIEENEASRPFI